MDNKKQISGRREACLRRDGLYEPRLFTKFFITPPTSDDEPYDVRSVVEDALFGDADVVVF